MSINDDSFDYNEDLHIDSEALDVEWLDQPKTFMKYARMLADAERDVDRAKENLDVVKANIDKRVRLKPEKYGLEKVTEKAIESAMQNVGEFKDASTDLINAKHNQSMAKAAVEAFRQRKNALENLVQLYLGQYFAGPKIPRDLSKEWEAKQVRKRSNQAVAEKLNKNVKRKRTK